MGQGLVFKFSADVAGAQKSLADFALQGISMMASMGREAIETQKAVSSLGTAATGLRTLVGGVIAFEALKFAISETTAAAEHARQELTALNEIGRKAANLGVGSTFFQQFTKDAHQLGLEADMLTAILQHLLEVSKVSLGTAGETEQSEAQKAIAGKIAEGNLPKGADKAFDAASTQEARLRAALDLLSQLQAKGAQLAEFDLGNKLFGADFEGKLRGDDQFVAKLQQRLQDMASGKGANVIPPEQLAAAKEISAELEDLDNRIQNALIPFHNDLRGWQQEELQSVVQLKQYWTDLVEVFGQVWTWCDKIGATINSWGNAAPFQRLVAWMNSVGMIDKSIQQMGPFLPPGGMPKDTAPPLTVTRGAGDTSKPHLATAERDAAQKTDPVKTYIDELTKAAAAEAAEAATLGLSNKAKQEAIDLAKAQAIATREHRTLTDAETAEVKKQADAFSDAKTKIDAFNHAQEQAKERAQFFGTEFEGAIDRLVVSGDKLKDVMLSVAQAIESAALKALILGEGPLAGLFGMAPAAGATGAASVGGLFGMATQAFGGASTGAGGTGAGVGLFGGGGLFGGLSGLLKFFGFMAEGGTVPPGGFAVAGERGPEIVMGPGTVVPMMRIPQVPMPKMPPSGRGGASSFTHAPTYNIMPAGGVTPGELASVLERHDADLNRTFGARMSEWDRRYRR